MVVVEFQSRPESHLRGPLSTQDAINLQDTAGVSNAQLAGLLAQGSGAALDVEAILADFESDTARKRRLFSTYLAERRYFMMAADYIRSLVRYGRLPTCAPIYTQDLRALYRLKFSPPPERRRAMPAVFQAYKGVFEKSLDGITTGLGFVSDEVLLNEDMSVDYNRTVITEAIHALSVIFQDLDSPSDAELFTPSGMVMGWFKLMASCAFLQVLDHEVSRY